MAALLAEYEDFAKRQESPFSVYSRYKDKLDEATSALDTESEAAVQEALERLLAEEPSAIYPAHGPRIADGGAKIREYIDHRLAREREIVAAIEGGAGVGAAAVTDRGRVKNTSKKMEAILCTMLLS